VARSVRETYANASTHCIRMTGVNKNVAGKQKRIVARYMGSAPEFRQKCSEVASADYDGFKKL